MKRTALLLLFAVTLFGCSTASTPDAQLSANKPAAANARPVPEFDLVKLDGGSLKSSDLKGKVTVIDFWATWCESCLPEIPHYNELRKKYAGKGAEVLGFTMDSGSAEDIKPKAAEFKIEYPLILSNDTVAEGFGIIGYPTTFVVAPDGTIYKRYIGALPDKPQKLEKDIETLLNNSRQGT
jgi:thiol-disulfide isomerase/thioredoxin